MKETVTLSAHENQRIKVFDLETIMVMSAIAVITNITALERTLHVGMIERQLEKTRSSELMDKTRVAIAVTSQIRARGLSIDPDNVHAARAIMSSG